METTLTNSESIVKSWTYAKSKEGKGLNKATAKSSLVVTNKRIINITQSNRAYSREEVDIKSVKSIACSGRSGANFMLLIMAGMFFLMTIVTFFLPTMLQTDDSVLTYIGLVPLAMTVVCVLVFIFTLGAKFRLIIYTDGVDTPTLTLGAIATSRRRRKEKANIIKVKVNYAAALEIMQEIGTLITSAKENA